MGEEDDGEINLFIKLNPLSLLFNKSIELPLEKAIYIFIFYILYFIFYILYFIFYILYFIFYLYKYYIFYIIYIFLFYIYIYFIFYIFIIIMALTLFCNNLN